MFFSGPYVVQSAQWGLCMKATQAYMTFVKFHSPVTTTLKEMTDAVHRHAHILDAVDHRLQWCAAGARDLRSLTEGEIHRNVDDLTRDVQVVRWRGQGSCARQHFAHGLIEPLMTAATADARGLYLSVGGQLDLENGRALETSHFRSSRVTAVFRQPLP